MRALPPHTVSIASGFSRSSLRREVLGSARNADPRPPPTAKPRSLFVHSHAPLCGTAFARAGLGARPARLLKPGAPLAIRSTHSEEPRASSRAGNPRNPRPGYSPPRETA